MFTKKDYMKFFEQLYDIEIGMKKEATDLYKIVKNKEARAIIRRVINDEIRHAKIVKKMMKII